MKKASSLLLISLFFLFFPRHSFAKVYINEFSSRGSSDWVEVYRTEDEDMSLYHLKDAVDNQENLVKIEKMVSLYR